MRRGATLLAIAILSGGIAATVIASSGAAGAAEATSDIPSFVSYQAPTGPELSSSAIASEAIQFAREAGDSGTLTVELAHGTLTEAKTLLDGGSIVAAETRESELRSSAPSSTFCFGGANANCTTSEQLHAKEVLYAEGQASTYLVSLSGTAFKPPERLPKGRVPVVASKVLLLIDAHTGMRVGMTLGGSTTTPGLSALHEPRTYTAAAVSASSATTKATHSHPREAGLIAGRIVVNGRHSRMIVVVTNRSGAVVDRSVSRNSSFASEVRPGDYWVTVPSVKRCQRKKVVVADRKVSHIVIRCAGEPTHR